MMEKKEVTVEISFFCGICLSTGRALKPLGNYLEMFINIMKNAKIVSKLSPEMQVCWECRAVLSKTWCLRKRAFKAWRTLHSIEVNGLKDLPVDSFSTLSTTFLCQNDSIVIEYKNDEESKEYKNDDLKECKNDEYSEKYKNDEYSEKYKNDEDSKDSKNVESSKEYKKDEDSKMCNNNKDSNAFIKCESPENFDNSTSTDEDFFENKNENLGNEIKETLKTDLNEIKKEPVSPGILVVDLAKKRSRGPIKKIKFKTITVKNRNKEVKDYVKLKISHVELINYMNKERLKNHYKIKPYKCESCILGWKHKEALLEHNKEYHVKSRGPYICDVCKMRCSQKNAILQHIQKHYFKHRCLICNEDFYEKERIFYHMNRKHWDVRLHECLECGLRFNSRRDFFKHYKEMHRRFDCDLCGKSCTTKGKIIKHLQEAHEPLYCQICDVHFKAYKYYRNHKLNVHMKKISEDSYCVECDLQFDNVSKYKRHLNNSVKHKPKKKISIPCPMCQKVFCKKVTMKNHYNLVHLQRSKHYCDSCDRYFLNGWRYRQHKASVHDKIAPVKNKFCDICGRAFAQNRTLMNHIRTHTGEKPYACAHCPARFAQRTAMLTHFKTIHHKNEAY